MIAVLTAVLVEEDDVRHRIDGMLGRGILARVGPLGRLDDAVRRAGAILAVLASGLLLAGCIGSQNPVIRAPDCTPPPCDSEAGEVYYCPGECPGGCGTGCATATPAPTATLAPTSTEGTAAVPGTCEAVANEEVWVYARPPITETLSTTVEVFAKMSAGTRVTIEGRTAHGWLGFDPGVAQAANVGVFRLRWLDPGDPVTLEGDCGAVPEVVGPLPGVCYTMPMGETDVYQSADTASTVLATVGWGGYAAVLGKTADDNWAKIDLSIGSLGLDQQGWVEGSTLNLNGDRCSDLATVTP